MDKQLYREKELSQVLCAHGFSPPAGMIKLSLLAFIVLTHFYRFYARSWVRHAIGMFLPSERFIHYLKFEMTSSILNQSFLNFIFLSLSPPSPCLLYFLLVIAYAHHLRTVIQRTSFSIFFLFPEENLPTIRVTSDTLSISYLCIFHLIDYWQVYLVCALWTWDCSLYFSGQLEFLY